MAEKRIDTKPVLCDYVTGEQLRNATEDERALSVQAAEHDGGAGVFLLDDGRAVYVED